MDEFVTILFTPINPLAMSKYFAKFWTGIKKGLLKSGDVHICVDSVLNARQDMEQKKSGISIELLKTDGSRLWIIGLIALLIFAYTLTLDIIPIYLRLLMLGVISSLYYLYDITVHEFSKNRRTLDGVGDYGDLLRMYLRWSPKDS